MAANDKYKHTVEVINNKVVVRAVLANKTVENIAQELFGLENVDDVKELNSYEDTNFYMKGIMCDAEKSKEYVMKIYNSGETYGRCKTITQLSEHCYKVMKGILFIPKPVPVFNNKNASKFIATKNIPLAENYKVKNGASLSHMKLENLHFHDNHYTVEHFVTMFEYIPGDIMKKEDLDGDTAYQMGKYCSMLQAGLESFSYHGELPAENHIWNLLCNSEVLLNPYVEDLSENSLKSKLKQILDDCDKFAMHKLESLPRQWIHGDLNEQNIIIRDKQICGVIDFGDIAYSYKVIDIAVLLSYFCILSGPKNVLQYTKCFFDGYESKRPLTTMERDVIYYFMMKRFVQCIAIGFYRYKHVDPENDYLLIQCKPAVLVLDYLCSGEGKTEMLKIIKHET